MGMADTDLAEILAVHPYNRINMVLKAMLVGMVDDPQMAILKVVIQAWMDTEVNLRTDTTHMRQEVTPALVADLMRTPVIQGAHNQTMVL